MKVIGISSPVWSVKKMKNKHMFISAENADTITDDLI